MRGTTGLSAMPLLALLALGTLRGRAEPAPPKVDEKAVNRSINRGVAYLKKQQDAAKGTWDYGGDGKTKGALSLGMTALAGLTLLHCGVDAKDPSVQNAARALRIAWAAMLRNHEEGRDVDTTYERRTYSVALTILFLDQLGEADDDRLIRLLTVWLVNAQDPETGSWGYGSTLSPKNRDSSNTQFALLGLWAGRGHGVRIGVPLARTAARCYQTHNADGGWAYSPEDGRKTSTLAMSSAGLMTLALLHAAANEDILRRRGDARSTKALSNVAQDVHVVLGFRYVHQCLQAASDAGASWKGDASGGPNAYYTLWSLERAAVAYNLRTIGDLDWYAIGARFLLANQQTDGHWQGSWGQADTCFALLFLRRANLVPEATNLLEGKIARDDKPALSSSVSSPTPPSAALEKILAPTSAPEPTDKELTKRLADSALEKMLLQFRDASATEQDLLLKKWRDGDDALYTPALAKAITTLPDAAQRKARAALTDHCTRLTTLQRDDGLRASDAEIRRAAALSCAVRDAHQHLDRLIELLLDKEPQVVEAAHAALCSLTGHDFGPPAPSTAAQRATAAKAWQAWRKK